MKSAVKEFGMRAFAGFAVFAFLIASAAAAERLPAFAREENARATARLAEAPEARRRQPIGSVGARGFQPSGSVGARGFTIAVGARAFQASGASAENGKRLFMTYYCYSCHGTEGHGGAGPRLIARATPDALIRYVRKPTGGNMPPYTRKVISDQDLVDIHAYLRSVPPSPTAKGLPLLQQ